MATARDGFVCAACGGVIPPMDLDLVSGRGGCPDCGHAVTVPAPPPPRPRAPARPSALLWVTRRTAHGALVDAGPFRRAGAARPETVVELRAVDSDDPRPAVTVTATALHGVASVRRADVTELRCAAAPEGGWELVAVAGDRVRLARGTPPSIVAMADYVSAELGLPRRDRAHAVAAPVVPGVVRRDDGALAVVPRRRRSLHAFVEALLTAGLVLDRERLRWWDGGHEHGVALGAIERFVFADDRQLTVIAHRRRRVLWHDLVDARALATVLNLELDWLRDVDRRR